MKKLYLLPLCAAAFVAGCAPFGSSSEPTLEQRVELQDARLRQIEPRQADAWNQIEAMKQEIASLRGQLDDLNNAGGARALADRVRQHDAALRQVDNNMALNLELGSPMTAAPRAETAYAPVPGEVPLIGQPAEPIAPAIQPTGAPDSSAYGAARLSQATETGNYGLIDETGAQTANHPATQSVVLPASQAIVNPSAPTEETWGQADPQPEPVAPAPKKDISLALFDAGLNSYHSRDYAAAERSFRDFLKNYPSHSQTAEAQYYLAESMFQRNQFPEAALAYDAVIKKYPKSSSAPGAYLKQAICFSKMKQPDAAKARMKEIISKFPKSAEATRARTFLKTNK